MDRGTGGQGEPEDIPPDGHSSASTRSTRALAPDPVEEASGEITGAVVGSTLTTVLVFVPLAFIPGVYGQFFASPQNAVFKIQ